MKKIILDTNFLMIPYTFKVDILEEIKRIASFKYEFYIMEGSIGELEGIIATQRGKDKEAARFALSIIKGKHLKTLRKNQGNTVDEAIVEIADKDTVVATQDAGLKRKLRQKGVPLIVLRQKKYLMLLGV